MLFRPMSVLACFHVRYSWRIQVASSLFLSVRNARCHSLCCGIETGAMSSLTPEQRRRAEENRQKALARRRTAQTSASATSNSTTATSGGNFHSRHGAAVAAGNQTRAFSTTSNSSASKASVSESRRNAYAQYYRQKHHGIVPSRPLSRSEMAAAATASQPINVIFRMTSRDRFAADLPRSSTQILEVFKSMRTKNYNPGKTEWSFALSEHDALVKNLAKLNNCRPKPIPSKVVKMLLGSDPLQSSSPDLGHIGPTLLNALFPFQKQGIEFGISRNGRVLLADEMGLGKTVQAIALAAYYRNEWPVLIVSPSSVQYMWAKSFLRWIPSLEESDVNVFRKGTDDPNKGLINIASYGLLSRHPKLFQEERYQVVILDESHFIKNRTTQRYKAVAPVLQRASRAILLSGTPALSRPMELYTQVECVRPKLLPYAQEYGIRYCAGFQGPFGWDFTGNSNPLELQNFLEATVMLRRLKAEVMDQMPAKSRKLVLLDPKALTGVRKATKISNALALNSAKGRDQREDTRAMLLELYSISAQSKLPAVKTYIQESLQDVSEKMVVFAHHQTMLDGLEELIKSMKLDFIRIDGKTNSKARQVYCDKFQNDTDCRVALLSITAAGIGITLTAAARAVFTELYWNPGILIQGEDRVYRIGQKSNVAIQYLVAQGTVDDHIWPMVNKKLGVLEQFGVGLGTFKGVDTHVQKSDEGLQPDLFDYWSDVLDVKDVDVAGGEVPVDVTAGDADSQASAAAPGQCDPPVSGTAGVDIDDDACDVPDIDLDAELKDLNDASAGSWQDEDLATSDVEYAGAEHAEDANSVDFDFHTAASDDDGTGIDYDALLVASDDEQIMRTSSKAAAGAAADKHSGGVSLEPSAKRRC